MVYYHAKPFFVAFTNSEKKERDRTGHFLVENVS